MSDPANFPPAAAQVPTPMTPAHTADSSSLNSQIHAIGLEKLAHQTPTNAAPLTTHTGAVNTTPKENTMQQVKDFLHQGDANTLAEKMKGLPEGSFLVRKSSDGQSFTLQMIKGDVINHYRFQIEENGKIFQSYPRRDPAFGSFKDFIEAKESSLEKGVSSQERSPKEVKSCLHEIGSVHSEQKEVTHFLHEGDANTLAEKLNRQPDGAFLVRKSSDGQSLTLQMKSGASITNYRFQIDDNGKILQTYPKAGNPFPSFKGFVEAKSSTLDQGISKFQLMNEQELIKAFESHTDPLSFLSDVIKEADRLGFQDGIPGKSDMQGKSYGRKLLYQAVVLYATRVQHINPLDSKVLDNTDAALRDLFLTTKEMNPALKELMSSAFKAWVLFEQLQR